jgi:hypothetical protein
VSAVISVLPAAFQLASRLSASASRLPGATLHTIRYFGLTTEELKVLDSLDTCVRGDPEPRDVTLKNFRQAHPRSLTSQGGTAGRWSRARSAVAASARTTTIAAACGRRDHASVRLWPTSTYSATIVPCPAARGNGM